MKRTALLVVIVAAVAAAQASAASRPRVTFVTQTVSPGGTVTIKATAPPGASCNATLDPASFPAARGTPIKLGTRSFPSGQAAWTYKLSTNAHLGVWFIFVACSNRAGSASARFTVAAPAIAPAQITVGKTGFSVDTTLPSTVLLGCGVELRNTSTVSDARALTVTVTFLDTQGRSLTTSEVDLTAIPAGQTFYASCLTLVHVTLTVGSVQVAVKVAKSAAHTATLPIVGGLKLTPNTSFGVTTDQTLGGTITNPYTKAMPPSARIYAVYYDANGKVIGGDSQSTGASIQPGATVGFSFSYLSTSIASAQVSVDPCGFSADTADCPLP